MATNTKRLYNKRKKKGKKNTSSWREIYESRRFRLSMGLVFVFISAFMTFAFLSYLFTGKADQSTVESVGLYGLIGSGKEMRNWLGLSGAILSYLFIYKWFGVASFLVIPLVFNVGYRVMYLRSLFGEWRILKIVSFALFWGSTVLGYFTLKTDISSLAFYCGQVGFEFAMISQSLFGSVGTPILLAVILGIFVVLNLEFNRAFGVNTSTITRKVKAKKVKKTSAPMPEKTKVPERKESEVKASGEITIDLPDNEKNSDESAENNANNAKENSTQTKQAEETGKETTAGESLDLGVDLSKKTSEKKSKGEPEFSVEDRSQPQDTPVSVEQMKIPGTELSEKELQVIAEKKETEKEFIPFDPTLDLGKFKNPPLELLDERKSQKGGVTREELEGNKDKIVETLINFKIGIESIRATIGPTVTLYEIVPQAGIKISKIKNLEDDIALSLSALGIRIIAPIPGRGTIGIEVPNINREMVSMWSVISTPQFMSSKKALPIVLGRTISNEVFVTDLSKMPHLLMAGATGQGKSVGINVILTSLLYKKHPAEIKFVLVDPKKVELSLFSKIERHYLAALPNVEEPIITDTKQVVHTLNSLCVEMDVRYNLLKTASTRNIKEYNAKFIQRRLNPEDGHRYLPYIVLIIDELADLMMTAGKDVEMPIARLAQLARAIGIHLVVATQRPSVNVITGIIKANFPARLSFRVTSRVDSRTILDGNGADQLVGAGDMLLSNGSDIIRLQCAFVDTEEVEKVCEYIGDQQGYESAYMLPETEDEEAESRKIDLSKRDSMFDEAARLVVVNQQGSTSMIQRKLSLGYNRAGRIIDQLEAAGIVGGFEGSKARQVLVQDEYALEQILNSLD